MFVVFEEIVITWEIYIGKFFFVLYLWFVSLETEHTIPLQS
jgi:hypothetical protein